MLDVKSTPVHLRAASRHHGFISRQDLSSGKKRRIRFLGRLEKRAVPKNLRLTAVCSLLVHCTSSFESSQSFSSFLETVHAAGRRLCNVRFDFFRASRYRTAPVVSVTLKETWIID